MNDSVSGLIIIFDVRLPAFGLLLKELLVSDENALFIGNTRPQLLQPTVRYWITSQMLLLLGIPNISNA